MLDAFLERMAATPFVDGRTDCALTLADWVVLNGHADPASDLRGRYRTALGRERIVRRHGGLVRVVGDRLERVVLAETANPVRGDGGVVRLAGRDLAAICVGGGHWAAKTDGLWVGHPDEVLKAWRV